MPWVGAHNRLHFATYHSFRPVNTTPRIDYATEAILEIQCSRKQPQGIQIAWELLPRNLDKLNVLTDDKRYDRELLRHKLRSEGIKPVIKYRECGWHGVANNLVFGDTAYH